jgi:hypothetical protein
MATAAERFEADKKFTYRALQDARQYVTDVDRTGAKAEAIYERLAKANRLMYPWSTDGSDAQSKKAIEYIHEITSILSDKIGPASRREFREQGGRRDHATKKSPAQLQREIDDTLATSLRGSSGEQSDVLIVARPKDWDLIEESLKLDVQSSAFDSVLRWKISEALGALDVGTTYQGRGKKVVARARQKDWKLLEETLQADAQSKRLPKHEREDLQAALKRLVIKPWPQS